LLGWSENVYDNSTIPITIVAITAGFAASWLLLRYLDRNPSTNDTGDAPPPTFYPSI
jgi:multidrug resistance efflux pump